MKEFIGATILAVVLAFALTAVFGPMFINWLHKLKYGQEIREEGPAWHQKKSGTPTMGGIMFIIGIAASIVINIAITIMRITKVIPAPTLPKSFATSPPITAPITPPLASEGALFQTSEICSEIIDEEVGYAEEQKYDYHKKNSRKERRKIFELCYLPCRANASV